VQVAILPGALSGLSGAFAENPQGRGSSGTSVIRLHAAQGAHAGMTQNGDTIPPGCRWLPGASHDPRSPPAVRGIGIPRSYPAGYLGGHDMKTQYPSRSESKRHRGSPSLVQSRQCRAVVESLPGNRRECRVPGMLTEFGRKSGNKIAIVFIHGFTGDAAGTWTGVPGFLQADPRLAGFDFFGFGYPTTKSYDLVGFWSADPRIQEIALALSTGMSSGGMAQYEGIALVAHSMGGLVAQLALENDEALRKRTTHLALFGTPSAGLRKAGLLSFWKRQIANMDAAGPFIKDLRTRWATLGFDHPTFRFITVAGELDQFVPPESSLMPFPESSRRVIPGNHLTMIRASSAKDPAVVLLTDFLVAGAGAAGARSASRLALESRQFTRVIDALGSDPKSLDKAAAVDLAIALDSTGRRDEAIAVLAPHAETDTDAMGTLAGRLKRNWLASRHRADAERALELYTRAYRIAVSKVPPDHGQAYYHGINIAFLELAYGGDIGAAQEMAEETLEHCEAAIRVATGEHWRLATEGDALIILGRVEEGIRQHQLAMQNPSRVKPWQALSIQEQSVRIADLCGIEEAALRRLVEIYQPPAAAAIA